MPTKLLVWLHEKDSDDASLVGEKATKLGKLSRLGIPIIPGFVITSLAFDEFIQKNSLDKKISHIKGGVDEDKQKKSIQKEFDSAKLPQSLIDQLLQAYLTLSGKLTNTPLLLTSSLSAPIHLTGEANLLIALKKFWQEALGASTHPALLVQHDIPVEKKGLYSPDATNDKEFLGNLITEIQKEFYFPQEIQWIFSSNKLFITSVKEFTPSLSKHIPKTVYTATKVYAHLSNLREAQDLALQHIDAVVFTLPKQTQKHLDEKSLQEFETTAKHTIATLARLFSPRQVIYKTDQFESDMFTRELTALAQVRNTMGLKNLSLIIPSVKTLSQLQEVKHILAKHGLYRSSLGKLWLSIDLPAQALLLEEFIKEGIDGVYIDSEKLPPALFGTNVQQLRNQKEMVDVSQQVYKQIIHISQKYAIHSSLYGSAVTDTTLLKNLVAWGITSVIVNPDEIELTREHIARFEKEFLQH